MAGMDALNDDTFGDMGADALNDDTFGDDDTFGADIGPPGGCKHLPTQALQRGSCANGSVWRATYSCARAGRRKMHERFL